MTRKTFRQKQGETGLNMQTWVDALAVAVGAKPLCFDLIVCEFSQW